ncbi:META domain-containing protein [Chitinophaga sp. Cy-1792]|uniref:META domain-containing protein n=1 Tax=Chitinophaga sp. Cy-1792 TaxID=2608339 RepID=UPI001423A63C|nr:META domain-containing protein [Chitinophaga sp. Cy-1792]NIG52310.1 META domain-containing protein [Chitinophaga sp. Cy-1792]
MLLKLAVALSTLFVSAQQQPITPKTEVMYVKESKVPCTGVAPMECLQVKTANESDWSNLYQNIQGFNYTPGYQYKLLVMVSPVKNPPADGSSIKYTLKKILEKKKVTINTGASPFVAGKRWTLEQMNGVTLDGDKIWLEFEAGKNRYHGNGGCNGIGGEAKVNEAAGIVSFTRGMSTMMACINEQDMRNETNFQRALEGKTYNYRVEDGHLNFYGNGRLMLSFKQTGNDQSSNEQPDVWTFISSKKWNLIKLGDNTLTESGIWLEFDVKKDRFFGSGGCNRINGGMKKTKSTVSLTQAISTRMACSPEIMKREHEFLQAIGGQTFKFDVAEQTLNFYQKNKLVMIFGMQDK